MSNLVAGEDRNKRYTENENQNFPNRLYAACQFSLVYQGWIYPLLRQSWLARYHLNLLLIMVSNRPVYRTSGWKRRTCVGLALLLRSPKDPFSRPDVCLFALFSSRSILQVRDNALITKPKMDSLTSLSLKPFLCHHCRLRMYPWNG